MTCIAAFIEDGAVWMGADSAGIGGYSLTVRADQKIFRNGPMLFGFTSSFRMGQLLRYALTVPHRHPDVPVDKFMSTVFVDAVRECLKSHGWARKREEVEEGGTFLVAYLGRLFCIQEDYQVAEALDPFDAVGCGHDIAKGALFATTQLRGQDRLKVVFDAAERYSAGVRAPFNFQSLEPST